MEPFRQETGSRHSSIAAAQNTCAFSGCRCVWCSRSCPQRLLVGAQPCAVAYGAFPGVGKKILGISLTPCGVRRRIFARTLDAFCPIGLSVHFARYYHLRDGACWPVGLGEPVGRPAVVQEHWEGPDRRGRTGGRSVGRIWRLRLARREAATAVRARRLGAPLRAAGWWSSAAHEYGRLGMHGRARWCRLCQARAQEAS
jgi:hypothetical protein